jgi:hypothetical protein
MVGKFPVRSESAKTHRGMSPYKRDVSMDGSVIQKPYLVDRKLSHQTELKVVDVQDMKQKTEDEETKEIINDLIIDER